MAKVKYVKSARKENPVAKIGESYYWWKFRYGGKLFSKTPPKSSQLTQSSFYSGWRSIEEDLDDNKPETIDDLQTLITDCVDRLRELADEAEESLSNMPDQLQDSEGGERLQTRSDEANSYADELEGIDLEFDYDQVFEDKINELDREDFDSDEAFIEAKSDAETDAQDELTSFVENAFDEAQNVNPGEPE